MTRFIIFCAFIAIVLYALSGHCEICGGTICFDQGDCGDCVCLIPNGQVTGYCVGGGN